MCIMALEARTGLSCVRAETAYTYMHTHIQTYIHTYTHTHLLYIYNNYYKQLLEAHTSLACVRVETGAARAQASHVCVCVCGGGWVSGVGGWLSE